MIKTLSVHDFLRTFANSARAEQFSREALVYIFDAIEAFETDMGEQIKLDVVAICCEWAEETYTDIAKSYSIDISDLNDEDATQAVLDYLCCEVRAYQVGDKIVYEQF